MQRRMRHYVYSVFTNGSISLVQIIGIFLLSAFPFAVLLAGFSSRANCHFVPHVVAVVKLTREIRIESIMWWIETQRDSCFEFKITHLLFVFHICKCKCINELHQCKHLNLIYLFFRFSFWNQNAVKSCSILF